MYTKYTNITQSITKQMNSCNHFLMVYILIYHTEGNLYVIFHSDICDVKCKCVISVNFLKYKYA